MVCPPGNRRFPQAGALGGASGARALARTTREPSFFTLASLFGARRSFLRRKKFIMVCPPGNRRFPQAGALGGASGAGALARTTREPSFFTLSNFFGARRSFLRRRKFIPVCPPGNRRFPQAGALGGASGARALARTTREPSFFTLANLFGARRSFLRRAHRKRGAADKSLRLPFWCARRESNPEPTASEAVTLSNCATDTRAALCRRLCLSL